MLDSSYLSDLWYFRAAADEQSFSLAAKRLNITQGAVSQRIRHLEARLGIELFQRVGRRVELTEIGRRLQEICERSFDDVAEELQRIKNIAEPDELILSCIPSFAMDWLFPRMGRWYEFSGGQRLGVRAEINRITRTTMLRDKIDLALQYDDAEHNDLHSLRLGGETMIPVAAPSLAFDPAADNIVEYLRVNNLIHDAEPWHGASSGEEWRCWAEATGICGVDFSKGDMFNLTHLATRAALAGQGVAIGRLLLVSEYLEKGQLQAIGSLSAPSPAEYKLLSLHEIDEGSKQAKFRDWLISEIGQASGFENQWM